MNYCYICRLFLKDSIGVARAFISSVFLPYYNKSGAIDIQKGNEKHINKSVCVCEHHYRQYAPPKKKELHKQSMFTKVWQVLRT